MESTHNIPNHNKTLIEGGAVVFVCVNLTQHIEDGYERGVVTGTVFVDLSAAYDTTATSYY